MIHDYYAHDGWLICNNCGHTPKLENEVHTPCAGTPVMSYGEWAARADRTLQSWFK